MFRRLKGQDGDLNGWIEDRTTAGITGAFGVVLCKVRLVGKWIMRREVMVGARRIKSKKLREH